MTVYNIFILDPEMWKALQLCRNRQLQPGVITDVYDGAAYKKHASFLAHPTNVSFILNTDGVAVFRSSTRSLWPVWLVINELPKQLRYVLTSHLT